MSADRKNLLICVCFVLLAVLMAGLTWFLKFMGLEYALGFASGLLLAIGGFGIISKDFRNLS
ncbi:hypothetical protein DTW90_12110 [Neorhizobium sp. P12A]|nr:hypothetical protein DTW90_12110 [Neorhizobium sp. P12A]